jgi:hypothetical protein
MKQILTTATVLWIMAFGAGCRDERVTNLEQRVNSLEQQIHQLESERNKSTSDESARRAKLESCVLAADAGYQRNMISNGTKARNGSYDVPVPLVAAMEKQKQGKIEECKLLYAK